MHHNAYTSVIILIVNFIIINYISKEFIFEEKRLNEISENKFSLKITRYIVVFYGMDYVCICSIMLWKIKDDILNKALEFCPQEEPTVQQALSNYTITYTAAFGVRWQVQGQSHGGGWLFGQEIQLCNYKKKK